MSLPVSDGHLLDDLARLAVNETATVIVGVAIYRTELVKHTFLFSGGSVDV